MGEKEKDPLKELIEKNIAQIEGVIASTECK